MDIEWNLKFLACGPSLEPLALGYFWISAGSKGIDCFAPGHTCSHPSAKWVARNRRLSLFILAGAMQFAWVSMIFPVCLASMKFASYLLFQPLQSSFAYHIVLAVVRCAAPSNWSNNLKPEEYDVCQSSCRKRSEGENHDTETPAPLEGDPTKQTTDM